MNLLNTHETCAQEKQKAMARMDSKTGPGKHDAATAVNAWDELLGQLRKPNDVSKKQFSKAKTTALRIAKMISSPPYRQSVQKKIQKLTLEN